MARLRTRRRRAPALLLALAAVAAGCTGDDDAGDSSSAPTVADPSTPPPTAPADVTAVGSGTGPSVPGTDPASTAPSTSAAAPSGVACGSLPLATATGATLAALVATTPDLSALTGLLDAAGLTERLSGPGPVTLIAPTNAAFDALDPATRDALEADPTGVLARVLGLHLVEGAHPMADLVSGGPVSG